MGSLSQKPGFVCSGRGHLSEQQQSPGYLSLGCGLHPLKDGVSQGSVSSATLFDTVVGPCLPAGLCPISCVPALF